MVLHLFSKYPPMKVLLMTIQNAPPGLDYDRDKKFSKYRQMRYKEQDRLARMDADYEKRKEIAECNKQREERLKAAEECTAKKRLKRQKKKRKRKQKKTKHNSGGEDRQQQVSSDDDGDSENGEVD